MQEAPKQTILLVEDDQDAVEAMRLLLEDEGYRVVSAPDADVALRQVHSEKPDLILLDVMMRTGTEGFHFVWTLRRDSDPACRDLPVILLSAIHQTTALKFYPDQSDGTYEPYEYLPVQGFLDKPASSEQVISEVKRVLKETSALTSNAPETEVPSQ